MHILISAIKTLVKTSFSGIVTLAPCAAGAGTGAGRGPGAGGAAALERKKENALFPRDYVDEAGAAQSIMQRKNPAICWTICGDNVIMSSP